METQLTNGGNPYYSVVEGKAGDSLSTQLIDLQINWKE
jgi:hypothetical protein